MGITCIEKAVFAFYFSSYRKVRRLIIFDIFNYRSQYNFEYESKYQNRVQKSAVDLKKYQKRKNRTRK